MERFFDPSNFTWRDVRETRYIDPRWLSRVVSFEWDDDWCQNNWTPEDQTELEENLRDFITGRR